MNCILPSAFIWSSNSDSEEEPITEEELAKLKEVEEKKEANHHVTKQMMEND